MCVENTYVCFYGDLMNLKQELYVKLHNSI